MTETTATYDVILLLEQPLSEQDARQIRRLHESIEDPVCYHILLPVEDAAARIESAMGAMAANEALTSPALVMNDLDLEEVQRELLEQARTDLSGCIDRLTRAGGDCAGEIVSVDPIDALAFKVTEVEAAEAIILTRPHVVSTFFHVDWTSRARRKLGVPVLHLLEHENFDKHDGCEGGR